MHVYLMCWPSGLQLCLATLHGTAMDFDHLQQLHLHDSGSPLQDIWFIYDMFDLSDMALMHSYDLVGHTGVLGNWHFNRSQFELSSSTGWVYIVCEWCGVIVRWCWLPRYVSSWPLYSSYWFSLFLASNFVSTHFKSWQVSLRLCHPFGFHSHRVWHRRHPFHGPNFSQRPSTYPAGPVGLLARFLDIL